MKERFKGSVKKGKTMPGADTNSDYNFLVAVIETRLEKIRTNKTKVDSGKTTRRESSSEETY